MSNLINVKRVCQGPELQYLLGGGGGGAGGKGTNYLHESRQKCVIEK